MNIGTAARILVLNALMGRIEPAFSVENSEPGKHGISYQDNFVVMTMCSGFVNNESLPISYHCWIGTISQFAERLIFGSYLPNGLMFPLYELGIRENSLTTECTMLDAHVSWAVQGEINRIIFEQNQPADSNAVYGCGAIAL